MSMAGPIMNYTNGGSRKKLFNMKYLTEDMMAGRTTHWNSSTKSIVIDSNINLDAKRVRSAIRSRSNSISLNESCLNKDASL